MQERQEEERKDTNARKGQIKHSLFAGNMIVYGENPKEWKQTKQLLELKHKFSKVSAYKVNMVKKKINYISVCWLQIIGKIFHPFPIVSKINKILRNKLNKRRAEYPC